MPDRIGPSHPPLPRLTLVLGGARSGKSRYAEALIEAAAPQALYIATAEPGDEEMRATHRRRIAPAAVARWTHDRGAAGARRDARAPRRGPDGRCWSIA